MDGETALLIERMMVSTSGNSGMHTIVPNSIMKTGRISSIPTDAHARVCYRMDPNRQTRKPVVLLIKIYAMRFYSLNNSPTLRP